MSRFIGFVVATTLLFSAPSFAATWYVNTAGTGDAPTIAAAVDSAVAGDSILVAAGTYYVEDAFVGPGVVMISESGPYVTKIVAPNSSSRVGISCWAFPFGHPYTEVSGFWYEGYMRLSGAGLSISSPNTEVFVRNSIFTGNRHGLWANLGAHVVADNCTFFENEYGLYIDATGALVELYYSIMWDHIYGSGGNTYTIGVAFLDIADYFNGYWILTTNPQFCGETVGNVYLQSDSPCAPGNHYWDAADMRVIGALPVGCSTVKTEDTSWGRVKAMYRE